MRLRRCALIIAALTAAASACSGGSTASEPTSSGGSDPTAPPTTETSEPVAPATTAPPGPPAVDEGLVRLGEMFDDEGAISLERALAVYAALILPLPDVEPLADADDLPDVAAPIAGRRLVGALDELAPDVAAVVEAELATLAEDPGDVVIEPGRAAHRDGEFDGGGGGEVPTPDELGEVIAGIVAGIEARTGHELRIPIRTRLVDFASRWLGQADAIPGPGGRASSCVLRVQERMFGGIVESATSTLAHEVWHCFQADADAEAFWNGPLWMIEGQAEWAGEAYVGGSPSSASPWNNWLLQPDLALTRRSYDAIGVFAVAAGRGVDPWTTMLPMLGRAAPQAVSTLFGGSDAATAIGYVATAVTRVPDYGNDWESTGPGITDAQAAELLTVPTDGADSASTTVGRFATMPVVLTIREGGDILRVEISGGTTGAAAIPGVGTVTIPPGGRADFCMRPDDCVCPDGSHPGGGGPLPAADPGEGAAAVGATGGGRVAVTAGRVSLEEACSSGLVGEWATTVEAVFDVLSAPYGEGPACDGPFRTRFTADGLFTSGYEATCSVAEQTATGYARFDGTYTTAKIDGQSTFSVDNITGEGTVTIQGTTMPLPIVDGYRQGLAGPVPYSIVGDQLTYSFSAPDGNTFTLTMTRVG